METITKRTIEEAEEMIKEYNQIPATAFPSSIKVTYDGGDITHHRLGISTRGYFTAMALQGILASGIGNIDARENVRYAIEYADLLIEELNK